LNDGPPRAIEVEDILFFHHDVVTLDEEASAPGILDEGALEAAVARPYAGFGEVELFPTPFSKAAALIECIIQRHPFVDANKRTGLKSGVYLLFKAGYVLPPSQQELSDITVDVAEHRLDVERLAHWLEEHAEPRNRF
jgi:death-on-curing protein